MKPDPYMTIADKALIRAEQEKQRQFMQETYAKEGTRTFETGATRDADSQKIDLEGFLSPIVLVAFGKYMHAARLRNQPEGQATRASDNWQKGIPLDAYMKSAWRHFHEMWLLHRGFEAFNEKGEPVTMETALMGLFFNVQGYSHEFLKATTHLKETK